MIIPDKNQVKIKIDEYKTKDKIKIMFPDEQWTKYHFNKAEYNLRCARINFNLNERRDFIRELEHVEDSAFNTYEWVAIMSYYAMFHAVSALLRKIGIKVGKEYTHEVTVNLLLYYFYYTKIIEEELLEMYEKAEEQAKLLVASYIFAKEERSKYQYGVNTDSQKKDAEKILNDAAEFISRLKDIEKKLSKELVAVKLGSRDL